MGHSKLFSNLRIASVALFGMLAYAGLLCAQISEATIQGTIKDPSGAVIPGATVTVKNVGTGLTRSAVTSASGGYVIPNLSAGDYSFSASSKGFGTYAISRVVLSPGQSATVDATLQVGATAQQVEVSAAVPLLTTTSSSVSQVVSPLTVERIPLNGRKFWQLTQLTPGVSYIPGGQEDRTGGNSIRAKVVNVTVNGQSSIWTGWSLDGSNVTEFELGGTLLQPNVDALQEFTVESANMPAQYGHTPTMINAILKSGTNTFHGDLFEFLRNDHLDARNFFFVPPPGTKLTKDTLKRNQFGGTVGGPIIRDKAWFFTDYQGARQRQGIVFNSVVPSLAERRGDFSELRQGSKPQSLVDPFTGKPFPDNVIPPQMISPQANFLLGFMPVPNQVVGATSRAVTLNSLAIDQDEGDVKVDLAVTPKDSLMQRYSIADNREQDPNAFPALKTNSLGSRVQDETLRWTRVFGPRLINSAQFGYYRSIFLFGAVLEGTDIDQMAGIQGFANPTRIGVPSFPTFNISGFTGFRGSPSDQRPKSNRIRTWQYTDTLRYVRGSHDVMAGMEWFHQTHGFFNGSRSVGDFTFKGTFTGNGLADFLLGLPDNVERDSFKTLNGNWDDFKSWFFQDNYKVSSDLTLNIGVRFEVNPFFHGIRGQVSALNFRTGKLIIPSEVLRDPNAQPDEPTLLDLFKDRIIFTGEAGLPESIRRSSKDWAPRLGFAWSPLGRQNTVLRGAYGIFYSFPDTNLFDNSVATVPFVATQTLFNTRPVPTRTLGDFFADAPLAAPNPSPGEPCPFGFVAASCATPTVTAGQIHSHSTRVQEWNFSVQHRVTDRTSFTISYAGSHTTRLQQFTQRNDPAPSPGNIQPRRPLPQYGPIGLLDLGGKGTYNAFQAKFESREWHGLTLLGAYTYSKCLDNGSDEGGVTTLLIPVNKAVCNFDLAHNGVISYDYALPFGRGKRFLKSASGWADELLGGWELSGVTTLQSGLPFTPTLSGDRANTGVGGQRPDLVGTPIEPETPSCWFFTSANSACRALLPNATDAFVLQPKQTRYGTSGRNILRADNLTQFDFSVLKNFRISESKSLQFRTEFFNLLNHPVFRAPSTAIDTSSGGQVSSTLNAARQIQFALKLNF